MAKTGSFFGKKLMMIFLFSIFPLQMLFAEVTVETTVDPNPVSVGEVLTLKVRVRSKEKVSSREVVIPKIKNMKKLNDWVSYNSQSTTVYGSQGVNFKTVYVVDYNAQYTALKEGKVKIPAFQVVVNKKTHLTESFQLEILAKNPSSPSSPVAKPKVFRGFPGASGNDQKKMEERMAQLLKHSFGNFKPFFGYSKEQLRSSKKNEFFILPKVEKTEAFKGEQIMVSWYLYTQGRVRDIDTLKYPTLKGFWKEDIHFSNRLEYEPDVIEGVLYNRYRLVSYALFPIDEGKAVIDPYQVEATVVGFGFRSLQAVKSSESIPVLIKPLPEKGRPDAFTGAVGKFQMTVNVPDRTIITHQPFALKVRFEGMQGNAKLIELPHLPIGRDLEVYDIKNESMFFKNGQSFKEFEILLVPRRSGEIVIGELRTSYFDPQKREYVSMNSKPIRLQVLPGVKQTSIGEERLKSGKKKRILPAIAMEWNPEFKPRSSFLFVWIFVGIIALLGLGVKLAVSLGLFVKSVSLEEIIETRFRRLNQLVEESSWRQLGIETVNTVYQTMGHVSGQGGVSEEIQKALAGMTPSLRREMEEPMRKSIEFFSLLGFGPKSYVRDFKDKERAQVKVDELKELLLKASRWGKGNDGFESKK